MSDKIEKFIASMSIVFPKRFEGEREQLEWFQTWTRALRSYDPWIIEAATQRIIDTRTERSFPLVSEVRKACAQVVSDERASRPQLKVSHVDQHGDPYALADALVNCSLGREAARDGWILSLHDFCRKERRLPAGYEIAACKKSAAEFDETLEDCYRGKGGPFGAALTRLGETMRARREEMIARFQGVRS